MPCPPTSWIARDGEVPFIHQAPRTGSDATHPDRTSCHCARRSGFSTRADLCANRRGLTRGNTNRCCCSSKGCCISLGRLLQVATGVPGCSSAKRAGRTDRRRIHRCRRWADSEPGPPSIKWAPDTGPRRSGAPEPMHRLGQYTARRRASTRSVRTPHGVAHRVRPDPSAETSLTSNVQPLQESHATPSVLVRSCVHA